MGPEGLQNDIVQQFRKAFEGQCIHLLIEGYRQLKLSNHYDVDWEEEKFSMELARLMKDCPKREEWKIHVVSENRLYSEEMYASDIAPKEAPKIDFHLLNWSYESEFIYNIEAKNLAEQDWKKKDGSAVSSSFLTGRYIDTGIGNFINDKYQNGCLTGYVLNGTATGVFNRINTLLKKRGKSFETLSIAAAINGHNFCYQSLHEKNGNGFILPHVFLEF